MSTLLKRRRLFLSSEDGLEDSHGDFTLPLSTELMDCQTVGLKCKAWLQEVQMRHSFRTIDATNNTFGIAVMGNEKSADPNNPPAQCFKRVVTLPYGTSTLTQILEFINVNYLPCYQNVEDDPNEVTSPYDNTDKAFLRMLSGLKPVCQDQPVTHRSWHSVGSVLQHICSQCQTKQHMDDVSAGGAVHIQQGLVCQSFVWVP